MGRTHLLTNVSHGLYKAWYSVHEPICRTIGRVNQPTGAVCAMVMLEGVSMARCVRYAQLTYSNITTLPQVNSFTNHPSHVRPVLFFHGAVGTSSYLGDLVVAVSHHAPVFLLDLGGGGATEAKRQRVLEEIQRIQSLWSGHFMLASPPPRVDFVAHSMGAGVAFSCAFDPATSIVDANTGAVSQKDPSRPLQPHPAVGKLVLIANPSTSKELTQLGSIGKVRDTFNILAEFDALMGSKMPPAIAPEQCRVLSAGHIGIVFDASLPGVVQSCLQH